MSKVLVVRKPDRTIHKVPLENKPGLMAYNNKLPLEKRWILEEMNEAEANKLPFIDKSYVTPAEAQEKLKKLAVESESKDARIAELEAMLAKNSAGATRETAEVMIEKIKAAQSAEEVKELLGSDDRKTVMDMADKKLASFRV